MITRIDSTIKPDVIFRLNDGNYYYNYDIQPQVVENIDEEGNLKQEIHYNFIEVMLHGIPSYERCTQAIIRAYISESEEFDLINSHAASQDDDKYNEYLTLLQKIKTQVKKDFDLINEVQAAVRKKLIEISEYDTSSNVNEFTYQGDKLWLSKDTRSNLIMRLNAEKASSVEETTLWFNNKKYILNVDDAINMLNALEIYASKCYDCTAQHKANVLNLSDIKGIEEYDYTAGYPEKLVF